MMPGISRRTFLWNAGAVNAALWLGSCASSGPGGNIVAPIVTGTPAVVPAGVDQSYAMMYGSVEGEKFPVPAIDLTKVNPAFLRSEVDYATSEPPGTIVVDPAGHYLYYVEAGGRATRYGVGVGKQGFEWSGDAIVHSKQEWPDWYPPSEMIARRPDIQPLLTDLQSGKGMPGGPRNPIGSRGLYLWQGNVDTLYRIHGTVEPYTIGQSVSSGCIRMINQDVIHLYGRVPVGTAVKVKAVRVG
jgi:lipoprotein-anchoring transpeptidase ErfK/SrfK